METRPFRTAVIGTGKIGIDLLYKIKRSPLLSCVLVAGRNSESSGLLLAKSQDIMVSSEGIDGVMERINEIDLVFDATSALAHVYHWERLKQTKVQVVDMTPSKLGAAVVPSVNLTAAATDRHVNMISCGGQSSIPIIAAVSQVLQSLDYVEVVSSIASMSAGAATRVNLDEYIHTTEKAILHFSKARQCKVILILNPAEPPVSMQTTISFRTEDADIKKITSAVESRVQQVKQYVPGYDLLVPPKQIEKDRVVLMIKVTGAGDFLPVYAGNLDIINCAAIAVAERMAMAKFEKSTSPTATW